MVQNLLQDCERKRGFVGAWYTSGSLHEPIYEILLEAGFDLVVRILSA
jgi:hypothetical protein